MEHFNFFSPAVVAVAQVLVLALQFYLAAAGKKNNNTDKKGTE